MRVSSSFLTPQNLLKPWHLCVTWPQSPSLQSVQRDIYLQLHLLQGEMPRMQVVICSRGEHFCAWTRKRNLAAWARGALSSFPLPVEPVPGQREQLLPGKRIPACLHWICPQFVTPAVGDIPGASLNLFLKSFRKEKDAEIHSWSVLTKYITSHRKKILPDSDFAYFGEAKLLRTWWYNYCHFGWQGGWGIWGCPFICWLYHCHCLHTRSPKLLQV